MLTRPDGMVFGNNLVDALEYSPYMRITLGTGPFTGHSDEDTPEFGKGDSPIRDILQLMKREKYAFAATIEYEYESGGRSAQVCRIR